MLKSLEFDIITLSETWLKENQMLLNLVQVPGYFAGFRHRDRIRGGGVGFYIKTSIKFKERQDLNALDDTMEHQWIEVSMKKKQSKMLIGTLYQPSSIPNEKVSWLEKFDSLLSKIIPQHDGPIVITGDFNIDTLRESNVCKMYTEILNTYNLTQNVSRATRKDTSLIDHIVSNQRLKLLTSHALTINSPSTITGFRPLKLKLNP